jgi:hypothetical protein
MRRIVDLVLLYTHASLETGVIAPHESDKNRKRQGPKAQKPDDLELVLARRMHIVDESLVFNPPMWMICDGNARRSELSLSFARGLLWLLAVGVNANARKGNEVIFPLLSRNPMGNPWRSF